MKSFKGIFPILNVEYQSTQQIFVLMKTPCFRLRIHKASIFRRRLSHTSSRCLWDVFNSFPRRTAKTIIYRKIRLGHTSEKFTIRVQADKVPRVISVDILKLLKQFLKAFYEVTASTNKNIISKIGYLKRYCRLSKEEMNE